MKKFLMIVALLGLAGCMTVGHKQFYHQVAPTKYPETQNVMVFKYRNVDINEIYNLFFSDFLVIGKSSFNGPYENPTYSFRFAKSIGADVFISSSQFKETRTSFMNLSTPTVSTTHFSGYSGSGSVYGTATTYGTTTTTVPIRVDRYDQDGIYLKNVNGIVPLWERKRQDYRKTSDNPIEGVWYNDNYQIEIFQSGEQLVAFINSKSEKEEWEIDELKMIFGKKSGVGVYLMGNKTPMPAEFGVNKFGHLEVKFIGKNALVSFARK